MQTLKKIRVMIVDDHAITRDGIKTLLSVYDDMVFAGEANNGREALELIKKINPDIILMDIDMPVMDGISATKQIKVLYPEIKVIALTSFADKNLVKDAIKAGVSGYIIKNISPDELVDSIRDSFSGKINLSPEATKAIVEEIKNPTTEKFHLSEQELKILKLLSEGYSNKQISKELYISHHTVKFHISNIFTKLGASNRAEAAAIATKKNIIS